MCRSRPISFSQCYFFVSNFLPILLTFHLWRLTFPPLFITRFTWNWRLCNSDMISQPEVSVFWFSVENLLYAFLFVKFYNICRNQNCEIVITKCMISNIKKFSMIFGAKFKIRFWMEWNVTKVKLNIVWQNSAEHTVNWQDEKEVLMNWRSRV